jgi:hypothetical protein
MAKLPLHSETFAARATELRNVDYGCEIPEVYAALHEALFL